MHKDGGHDYKKILGLSFLFYEAQRAGRLPSDQRVKWRRDSVLQDRDPSTGTDLSGGYFDAGGARAPLCWGLCRG